jgi:hypothetical protein
MARIKHLKIIFTPITIKILAVVFIGKGSVSTREYCVSNSAVVAINS